MPRAFALRRAIWYIVYAADTYYCLAAEREGEAPNGARNGGHLDQTQTQTKGTQNSSGFIKALQIGSLVLMLACAAATAVYLKQKGLTAADFKDYEPANLWLAAVLIILFYIIKSLSLVFPLPILYVGVAYIMPNIWQAFAVNLIGVVLSLAMPYYIGRFSGKGLVDKLTSRFPKIKKLDDFKSDNETLFVFILKLSGVLACDLSSLLLGAMNINFKKFMIGSVAGLLPLIAVWTFLGQNANLKSWKFYAALGAIILLAVASSVVYKKAVAKKAAKSTEG